MKKKYWLIGIGLSAILVLSACGGKETANEAASKQNASSSEKAEEKDNEKTYELKVGYGSIYGAPLADIAIDQGFFEEENLKVEMVPFQSSADGLNALQAGKIDIGLTFGSTAPLNFIAQGSNFELIGGHMEGGHPIVVKEEHKDEYKTLQDFKGKTIGSIPLHTNDVYFKSELQKAGIDIHKDVKFVEFKTLSAILEAVKTGKIDVGVSGTAHLTKTLKLGLAPILWINDLDKNAACCRVTVRGEISDDQAIAYKKFMKALIKAERVKLESPEKNLEASLDRFKNLPKEQINEIVNEPHLINSADPNKKETLEVWERMIKIGYVKEEDAKKIDVNSHLNLTFYEQALDELIKENPNDEYYKKVLERFKKQNL
ncbi:ABC transporter substrate-binding protein [Aeribacillus sp. SP014]